MPFDPRDYGLNPDEVFADWQVEPRFQDQPPMEPPGYSQMVAEPPLRYPDQEPQRSTFASRFLDTFADQPTNFRPGGSPLSAFLSSMANSGSQAYSIRRQRERALSPDSMENKNSLSRLNLARLKATTEEREKQKDRNLRLTIARMSASGKTKPGLATDPMVQREADLKAKGLGRYYAKPTTTAPGPSGDDPIAKGIMDGTLPPTILGNRLTQYSKPSLENVARHGYDLAKATQDWNAVSKYWATLNGRQQTQLRQSANTVIEGLDNLEKLNDQLSSLIPRGNADVLSKTALSAAAEWGVFGPEAQDIATRVIGQMATIQPELANVYQAGGVPSDKAMEQAHKTLNAGMPPLRMKSAISNERDNLRYRLNSIKTVGPLSPSNQGMPVVGSEIDRAREFARKNGLVK